MNRKVSDIRADLAETRREMRKNRIRRTSCFNGGLDPVTYRYNARMFELNVELNKAKAQNTKSEKE